MFLVTHIAFALISIVFVSYTTLSPSKNKLRITYLLTFGTLASGIIMTVSSPQHFGQTCLTGALYLGFIITTSLVARRKIAKEA